MEKGYLSGAILEKYRNVERRRYSVWVYDGSDIISVYEKQKPNTVEIWFEFSEFTRAYWKKMEEECVVEVKGNHFYNYVKMRRFFITYMLYATNLPGLREIPHDENGMARKDVLNKLMRIHPRIWNTLFAKVEMFPGGCTPEEEKDMEKQAKQLFCDHKGVVSPHEWIELYCNLTAFWEKFGLNYFDVMRLPNSLYVALRKIMQLDNNYTELSFEQDRQQSSAKRPPGRR